MRIWAGTLILGLAAAALAAPRRPAGRPAWTKQAAHFTQRAGRRWAAAVGRAENKNRSLALADAEARARAELLRFIQGKPPGGDLQGLVSGARQTNAFFLKRGVAYVEVQVEVGP